MIVRLAHKMVLSMTRTLIILDAVFIAGFLLGAFWAARPD
jgi:hypothetical protein